MERDLQRELALGKKVEIKIELEYPAGGGGRPNKFVVTPIINEIKQSKLILTQ